MESLKTEIGNKLNGGMRNFRTHSDENDSSFDKISHNSGEKVGKIVSGFSDSATEYLQNGRDYVKENPAKGVGLAVAAGVVAGSIITMAMRKKSS